MVEYTPAPVRVYGDFAAQAGTYTFSWQGTDGSTVEMRARFSFTFRRAGLSSPQPWTIVEHHSSSMPTSPLELELNRVREGLLERWNKNNAPLFFFLEEASWTSCGQGVCGP